jgi:hypothetical protein
MMGKHKVLTSMVALAAFLAFGRITIAQDEDPGAYHEVLKDGPENPDKVFVGDVLALSYTGRPGVPEGPEGIRTLSVQITGDSVSRVAVVTKPYPPPEPPTGGRAYYIAYLKAERKGQATVKVAQIYNNGARSAPFEFKVNVQARP